MTVSAMFNYRVEAVVKLLDLYLFIILIAGVLKVVLDIQISKCLMYMAFLFPILIRGMYIIDAYADRRIIHKMKFKANINEGEYCLIISTLIRMIERKSESDIGSLLSIAYYHRIGC